MNEQSVMHVLCRVTVDEVQFVPSGTLSAGARGMLDERTWK